MHIGTHTRDELVKLGNLAGNREINGLVTEFNSQTTENGGLNLVGDNQLLAFGNVTLGKGIGNLVKGRLVKFLDTRLTFRQSYKYKFFTKKKRTRHYLGGCDDNVELVSVSAHELLVSSNDLLSLGKTTILSKSLEKVGSDLGVLARLQELLNTLLLGCAVEGRVLKKSLDALVLGNNTLDLLEFLLNSIEDILLSSSSIKSCGITTVQSEQSQRSLNEINERVQVSQVNVMLR